MTHRSERVSRRLDEDRRRRDVGPRAPFAQIGGSATGNRSTHELVPIAFGDDRHEQLTRDQYARVVSRTVDDDVIAYNGAVDD
jgi:hypothetical protein